MKKYSIIGAVVATAVASAAAHAQSPPSLSQAAASTVPYLNIAGSSAAQSAIFNFIENTMCDNGPSSALVVKSSGNSNFLAVSCVTSKIVALGTGQLVTVYYRTEGGSVVGALPLVTGYTPYRLNLSGCTQPGGVGGAVTCTVSGTSSAGTTTAANGPFDSWGGAATIQDTVQLGVTDVEPGQLVVKDFPTNYSGSVWGYTANGFTQSSTQTGLAALAAVPVLQQVFGFAVDIPTADLNTANNNTTTYPGITGSFPTVNLSRDSAAAIFSAKVTNWNQVPDAITGNPITSVSLPIQVINREPGSGTRTSTNIFLYNYQCGGAGFIKAGPSSLNYSTTDDLTSAVTAGAGAITYASINNLEPYGTSFSALTLATINGVAPSTLAAAAGQYDFWFEATLVPNPSLSPSSAAAAISNFIQGAIVNLANAPVAADINVIPGAGTNVASIPFSTTGSSPTQVTTNGVSIYVNPYTRSGNSCNVPATTL